jgi:hypothetical protein
MEPKCQQEGYKYQDIFLDFQFVCGRFLFDHLAFVESVQWHFDFDFPSNLHLVSSSLLVSP